MCSTEHLRIWFPDSIVSSNVEIFWVSQFKKKQITAQFSSIALCPLRRNNIIIELLDEVSCVVNPKIIMWIEVEW